MLSFTLHDSTELRYRVETADQTEILGMLTILYDDKGWAFCPCENKVFHMDMLEEIISFTKSLRPAIAVESTLEAVKAIYGENNYKASAVHGHPLVTCCYGVFTVFYTGEKPIQVGYEKDFWWRPRGEYKGLTVYQSVAAL